MVNVNKLFITLVTNSHPSPTLSPAMSFTTSPVKIKVMDRRGGDKGRVFKVSVEMSDTNKNRTYL